MDISKFEMILLENEKRIYHYLLKFVRNAEDAEDLMQSVFISFYNKMDDIDEKAAIVYLYRTAHNKAINHLKSNKRYVSTDMEKFDRLPAPPVKTGINPRDEILQNAIAELPPKLAMVVNLQSYENMSYKEIATHMKTTVSAVESLLTRAKKILRKKIMQEMEKRGVS
ncbi:MAG TPA: sigma-70 family RNA polymerase sigma factor [Candidatus Cloacimonadota bacterium]|nr:sigma-70 family RNA polymerase sigma factor [Candidatus Cloacimonadota bacterium]HPT71467.1 sigma-70 family RNA polymerase sigma factor [Candidatus Cloacimonadota bacterium]